MSALRKADISPQVLIIPSKAHCKFARVDRKPRASEFLGPGGGVTASRFKGKIQGEIGVRCCLQFNQSAFNYSIWLACRFPDFGLSRTPSHLARPLHEKVWRSRWCHPAVNSKLLEPPEPPGTGALFLRTAPSIAPPPSPP